MSANFPFPESEVLAGVGESGRPISLAVSLQAPQLCVPRPEPHWDCCAAQDTSGGSSVMGQWNQSSFLGNRWQVEGGCNVSKAVLLSRSLFQTSHNRSHAWRQAPPSLCITSFISVCQPLFSHVWFLRQQPGATWSQCGGVPVESPRVSWVGRFWDSDLEAVQIQRLGLHWEQRSSALSS